MSHSSHREGVEPYATLCPGNHPAYCQCDLIARVREDEEDQWLPRYNAAEQRGYDAGERAGYAAALRDAVEAVKAVYTPQEGTYIGLCIHGDVVAAIAALTDGEAK